MRFFLLILFFLLSWNCMAQLPADFRSEQIYFSPEKSIYAPGDTVTVEGRVVCMSENELLPYSRYLYVELFNGKDSVLVRQKLSCKEKGYFYTRLATDYEWQDDVYYLRAYTQLMRNFSEESFPVHPVLLGKIFPQKNGEVNKLRCRIIPSGGKLVAGSLQSVAVSLCDELGYPVVADLYLQDENEDTLSAIKTSSSGLAQLNFIPQAGMKYFLAGKVDGIDCRFPVPEAVVGIKIEGSLNGNRLNYQILGAETVMDGYRLYLYDRKNGLSRLSEIRPKGIVVLDKVPDVASLFLTDSNLNILSEYTVTGKYRMMGNFQAPDYLEVGDTLRFSVDAEEIDTVLFRVITDTGVPVSYAESEVNFLADYVSPLPFPSHFYASQDAIDRGNALKTWLSTAFFKRFSLKEAIEKDTSIYMYLPETAMTFGGWVEKTNRHPLKNGTVVAYHTTNDWVYDAPTDENGRFRMAVDDFSDGNTFFLQALTPKGKPDFANFHIDDETYPPVVNAVPFHVPKPYHTESETFSGWDYSSQDGYVDPENGSRHLTLPDITVTARLLNEEPPKKTNKFYSTNFADREKIEKWDYQTLYDILKAMPGIVISPVYDDETGASWSIESTRGASVLNGGNSLPILVDGQRFGPSDYNNLLETPAVEIESVELLRPWQTLAYINGAINGAIVVKTRNYKERPPLPSKGTIYAPKGLTSVAKPDAGNIWIATCKGTYRLLLDVFTKSGVQSYEHPFEVK